MMPPASHLPLALAHPCSSCTIAQPILLIGGTGLLGRAFRELLQASALDHAATTRSELDLLRPDSIRRAIACGWGTVINAAGWTDVDRAESDPRGAERLNADAVLTLADACRDAGATLVHFSSDYVFDGRQRTPYHVDHPPAPRNAYGRSKALGESHLRHAGARFLLIRTSWLYAPWGRNFLTTIARLARTQPTIRVVNDQIGRPSCAVQVAAATLQLLQRGAEGTFHVCDAGQCSWFEFAVTIVRRLQTTCTVVPCTTADVPRPAPRPPYSVLDLSRTEDLLGPMPHWSANLELAVQRLERGTPD